MARGVSLLSISGFREHRWASCSDHHDVQPHGRATEMADGRSVCEDHGFLPHASWSRSSSVSDLRWLSKTKTLGRNSGWTYFHHSGSGRDDSVELALCEVRQAAPS